MSLAVILIPDEVEAKLNELQKKADDAQQNLQRINRVERNQ